MLTNMTRSKAIQLWFATVALLAVAAVAFGAVVSVATGSLLLALCFVPPAILFMLWPEAQTLTAGDVLRGTDRRR